MQIKQVWQSLRRLLKIINTTLDRYPWLYWCLVGVFMATAGYFRMWAAPISAGVDIGQFWGFAKLFEMHGLDFYRFADGTDPILPVNGWGYVYPPIWLLILRGALFVSPDSLATASMVDASWRVAMKLPIIASDIAIGGLIYWAIPGSKVQKIFLGSLWLIHPTSWYNSSIFGQFDAVAAVFLLASVILFARGKNWPAFVFAGLAVLTKQHTALAVLLMLVVLARQLDRRQFLTGCAILAGMGIIISVPFLLTGNFSGYLRSVLLPAQAPGYQLPLVYTFSGSGAIITYLHQVFNWDIERLFMLNSPILVIATIGTAILCYLKKIRIEQAALAGILLFIALFYRVNYQYLVIYIPIAIFALACTTKRWERSLTACLIIVPAIWLWLMDVYFWFWYLEPRVDDVPVILKWLGLTHYVPDIYYVILAGVLMLLSLAYVVVVFWRRPHPEIDETLQGE
jgi:uncharacterized membrane protein